MEPSPQQKLRSQYFSDALQSLTKRPGFNMLSMAKNTPTVLVIDDDEIIRQLLLALLDEINCKVLSASNGLAGLDLLRKNAVDLVITDIIMPGMEGLELVRTLKRDYPSVKIIAMSAYRGSGNLNYLKHAEAFGVDQTFQKPFEALEFLESVKTLTGIKNTHPE